MDVDKTVFWEVLFYPAYATFFSQPVESCVPVEVEEAACSLVGAVGPAWQAGMEAVVEVEDGGVQWQAGSQTEAA